MSLNLKNIVGDIFHTEEKEKAEEAKKQSDLLQKINATYGTKEAVSGGNTFNPYLKKDGSLFNPYIDYQRVLDNPNVSQAAKKYISQATGLTQKVFPTVQSKVVEPQVSGQTVNVVPRTGNTVPTKSTGNNIADSAQKYIGTPYVWGGESMEEGGMDCSGFVYNALKDAGYNVGRTTAQGYRSQGTVVRKSEMQPGDLIFFGSNPSNASHIGIYIGNGQMVHSAGGSKNTKSNPGKGVSIVSVDHRKDFLEARRY